jgi:OB-fold nucleic acid binding domain
MRSTVTAPRSPLALATNAPRPHRRPHRRCGRNHSSCDGHDRTVQPDADQPAQASSPTSRQAIRRRRGHRGVAQERIPTELDRELAQRVAGTTAIRDIEWRKHVKVAGRIRSLRVETARGTANLECEVTDGTGNLLIVFMGWRTIPGIESGTLLLVEGRVGSWKRRLAILNPNYELVGGT